MGREDDCLLRTGRHSTADVIEIITVSVQLAPTKPDMPRVQRQ